MMYAQVRLSDHSVIGAPGALPEVIAAWAGSDTLLADLTGETDPAFGFDGTGFWPVIVTTPAFDPALQVLAGTFTLGAPDPTVCAVPATADVRALTAAELAATLAAAQGLKGDALAAACAASILGGYTSTALGDEHTYPAKLTDQSNMTVSVTASLLPGLAAEWSTPFWCEDSSGIWAMRAHTAAQIQQAGHDGYAAILAAQVKLAGLQAQVAAATTVATVDAISW